MYRELRKFYFFIILFLFISCASTSKKNNYPAWYLYPPENDQEFLYGVGEGYNLDNATKLALKNISEQILITLSSETNIYKSETNVAYIEESEYSISEKTEEITFNDYKVVKTDSINDKFFALVKVNRKKLLQSQKNELKEIESEINQLDKSSINKSSLIRITALNKILKKTPEAKNKVRIIKVLEPTFNDNYYFNKYENYKKEKSDLINNLHFYIKTNENFDTKAGKIFRVYLNKSNINVIDKFKVNLIILDIYSDRINKRIYNNYISKIKIYISLIEKGQIIKSNILEIKGASTINYKEAQNNAIKVLDKQIKEQGLFKILKLE